MFHPSNANHMFFTPTPLSVYILREILLKKELPMGGFAKSMTGEALGDGKKMVRSGQGIIMSTHAPHWVSLCFFNLSAKLGITTDSSSVRKTFTTRLCLHTFPPSLESNNSKLHGFKICCYFLKYVK